MNQSIYNLVQKVITDKLPQVKYFGLYRNQFNKNTTDREINYPAVLLQIQPVNFNQQLNWNQDAVCNIVLHIGMEIVNNLEKGDKMIDKSVDLLELVDDINEVFDGLIGQEYSGTTESHVLIGEFSRVSQNIITNIKSIYIQQVTYSFPIVIAPKTPSVITVYPPTGTTSGFIFDIKTSGYTSL